MHTMPTTLCQRYLVIKKQQKMHVEAALVEATAQVIPWRQVDWNSCRLLLFLGKLKCKI